MSLGISLYNLITAAMVLSFAFVLTVILMPGAIPMLHRMKFGQEVRDDGPQEHLKKQGTPTMGGIVFLISIAAACAVGFVRDTSGMGAALPVLFLTLAFGVTGFADDYLKIKKHNSEGLKPRQKLFFQLLFAFVFALWVYLGGCSLSGSAVFIPFTGNFAHAFSIELPVFLFVPFVVFAALGTDNGVNFTDGLDGLCASVTSAVAVMFICLGLIYGRTGLITISSAVAGALLGYLIFNVYPAQVFMGDTGSLALGGYAAGAACICGMELYIPFFGFIYLIEVVSVIIQVAYFRKTGGGRFFRMAPIHHHFELLGHSETRIVAVFSIVTGLMCLACVLGAVY